MKVTIEPLITPAITAERYVIERDTLDDIATEIATLGDASKVSDGYHTFGELYDHRIALFIALCRARDMTADVVWRSKLHSDGSSIDGWFIMGIGTARGEQITYHLPMSRWDETEFADTWSQAPEFDGHTSNDVLARLRNL
jgi:hypothetical protein